MNTKETTMTNNAPRLVLPPGYGIFNLYFLAKIWLTYTGRMEFHIIGNLALVGFLLLPRTHRFWKNIHFTAATIAATVLAYHESWFPPINEVMLGLNNIKHFSLPYLFELSKRLVSVESIGIIFASLVAYWYLNHILRTSVIVSAILVLTAYQTRSRESEKPVAAATFAPVAQTHTTSITTAQTPDVELDAFHAAENTRKVTESLPPPDALPFDVIFFSVCSLAYDDLRVVGLDHHPVLQSFDITFQDFNTVTSYSGPAIIRLLRASCGQAAHSNLYDPASSDCYLMNQLAHSGFKPELLLNHDGAFGGFLDDIKANGQMTAEPIILTNSLPASIKAFDGSIIVRDFSALQSWFNKRDSDQIDRVALLYNSITLHDGNHLISGDGDGSTEDSYRMRAKSLLNDLQSVIQLISKSSRRVVLVLIPEHGAALAGDKLQLPGLREIPTPKITHVPVGVKLIGPGWSNKTAPHVITQPSSFLSLAQLIQNLVGTDPFGNSQEFEWERVLNDLPTTKHVGENSGTVVLKRGKGYVVKVHDSDWTDLSD